VRDQVSHPYKMRGKIIVYTVFMFLERRQEDRKFWSEYTYTQLMNCLVAIRLVSETEPRGEHSAFESFLELSANIKFCQKVGKLAKSATHTLDGKQIMSWSKVFEWNHKFMESCDLLEGDWCSGGLHHGMTIWNRCRMLCALMIISDGKDDCRES
jgi:hypothetical protein